MRARRIGLLLLLAAAPQAALGAERLPAGSTASGGERAAAIAAARDQVLPYVVSILAVREQVRGGEAQLSLSSGSGTVISAQGDVVTNAHVTQQGRAFRVVFGNGREYGAQLVGEDTLSDLAVLRIEGEGAAPFDHARFAEALELEAGDTVLAMGAPWGLSNSMSVGVVNNPRRLLVSLFQNEADYESRLGPDLPTGRYYAWIQHDAPIAPGNSGGPLVDLSGRIVGVNARGMIMGGNLAFAIPAPDARRIVESLVAHGEVVRADLGFRLRSLKGSPYTRGVLVHAVERGSVADEAGLLPGERILSLNGRTLDARESVAVPGLQQLIAELPIGSTARLDVEDASGHTRTLSLVARAYPRDRGQEALFAPFAAGLVELTPAMARRRALEASAGLLVSGVRAGGPAATARPALRPGDVIRSVDGRPVATLSDLDPWRALDEAAAQKGVRLEVLRDGATVLSWLQPRYGDFGSTPLPELARPWAGVEVQPIPGSLARALGLPEAGFRISRLYAGGPLAQAGAEVGDLVVALDGRPLRPLNDKDETSFAQRIRELDPGSDARLSLLRGGRELELSLRPVPAPTASAALATLESTRLRIKLRALGFHDRARLRLDPAQSGVVVTAVESGGPAGLAHVGDGDVITALGDEAVTDIDGFGAALDRALGAAGRELPIHVLRGAERRVLFLDRSWIAN